MSDIMGTIVFWIAFALISSWILRRFYFSKDKNLSRRLRVVAGILHVLVFTLLFFPWIPGPHGGLTGWGVILQGDMVMTFLAGLLAFSFVTLFVPKKLILAKAGILVHVATILLLFGFMIYTFPGTVTLALRDTAPIFATLILLINNVVLLLLWHELDKRSSHHI